MEVSILIPAFNAEETIVEAIQSALIQTVPLEVIVIDDGSTDATVALCESLGDSRVYVHRAHHGGVAAARNIGLQLAQGKWIALLDADDWMLPGRLSRLLMINQIDEIDIIADNLWVSRESQDNFELLLDESLNGAVSEIDLAEFLARNEMFGPKPALGYLKPIIRKRALLNYGIQYREDLSIGEDFALIALLLAEQCRFIRHHSAGYVYRKHSKSTSHRLRTIDIRGMIEFDREIGRRFPLSIAGRLALATHFSSLQRAYEFTYALELIKSKNVLKGAWDLASHPRTLPLLRFPIESRLRRICQAPKPR